MIKLAILLTLCCILNSYAEGHDHKCPPGKVYSQCGGHPSCQQHCIDSLLGPRPCFAICWPGCVCLPGTVLLGNKCVKEEDCPLADAADLSKNEAEDFEYNEIFAHDFENAQIAAPHLAPNSFSLHMSGLSNMNFEITDYCITDGQPWGGISEIGCYDYGCTITVMAGRHGSVQVADWFKNAIGSGSAIATANHDPLPGKLNFGYKGTISFYHAGKTFIGKEFVIAQGHNSASRNNWWIGGPNLSEIFDVPGALAAAQQTFKIEGSPLPALVLFSTYLGQVSHMNMGIIDVQAEE